MKIKFFIPLFFLLPLLRGGILEQKETEITEAILKLEKGEITSEGINQIIVLINELEKLAQEGSISSDDEDEEDENEEDEDIQEFQELRMLLVALQEYINSPSPEMLGKLNEWGEYRPEDCDLIEKAKKQVIIPN